MFTYKWFFVDRNAIVSSNFLNQNNFCRFWDIPKKRSKKTTFFMHDYNTWPYPVWQSKKGISRRQFWIESGSQVSFSAGFPISNAIIFKRVFHWLISFHSPRLRVANRPNALVHETKNIIDVIFINILL